MGLTAQERQIEFDYDKAKNYAEKYAFKFQAQIQARGLMLESAMRKFKAFTDLPASSSGVVSALEFAWAAVSVIPGFKIANLILKAETAEKLTKATSAVQELVSQGKDAYDKAVGIDEKRTAAWGDGPDGLGELAKLDVSLGPIQALVADTRRMIAIWGRTLDFLAAEKFARLSKPDKLYPHSMESYAYDRLPDLQIFTNDELSQVELEYLWQLISYYVQHSTAFFIAGDGELYIQNLNNTQKTTILQLFGPDAKRGRYFSRMFGSSIEAYLIAMGKKPQELWGDVAIARR